MDKQTMEKELRSGPKSGRTGVNWELLGVCTFEHPL